MCSTSKPHVSCFQPTDHMCPLFNPQITCPLCLINNPQVPCVQPHNHMSRQLAPSLQNTCPPCHNSKIQVLVSVQRKKKTPNQHMKNKSHTTAIYLQNPFHRLLFVFCLVLGAVHFDVSHLLLLMF